MMIKQTLIATALSLVLIGNVQAGVKDWLKNKKDQIKEQVKPQSAEGAAADAEEDADLKEAHRKLDEWGARNKASGEIAGCERFLKDQRAGKVALSAETGARFERCNALINGPKNLDTITVKGQRPTTPQVDKGKAMEVAGKGCAIGGLLGGFLGVDPAIGCAVGGLAGYGVSYKKQIKDAREVETAARAAGMDATVRTEQRVDEKGKKQETLAALSIRYEAADMEAMEPKTVAMLDRLASLAIKSKSTLTIRFEGTKACQIPLMELNNRKALERHTVVNECGKSSANQIVVSPLPIPR